MLSRVFKAAPLRLASVSQRRAIHVSASRQDLIQDFYSNEIKAFKPRPLTEKDAEGSVLKWTAPSAPKAPAEEVQVSDLDSYAKAPVEVAGSGAATTEASDAGATSGDWFPIESCDELDAH